MNRSKLQQVLGLIGVSGLLLGGMMTASAQSSLKATITPRPSLTPAPTATMTPTPTPQGSLIVLQITSGEDDVNESSGKFDAEQADLWIGNAGAIGEQFLGLRFTKVAIPSGALIHAAHLEVYTSTDQWIALSYDIFAEAADDSAPFSETAPPSTRERTTNVSSHSSNVPWVANTQYPLDEMGAVIQEVISRPEWKTGNSLSLIVMGTEDGGEFGRKFFTALESDPKRAVRLVIDVSPGTGAPSSASPTPPATAVAESCDTASLPARLKVGQTGRIVTDSPAVTTSVTLYKTASESSDAIGQLAPGASFTVIDGPLCINKVVWFKVQSSDNKAEGWLIEGQNNAYFVEPVR